MSPIYFLLISTIMAQPPPTPSAECLHASVSCESDTDCLHRLSALAATCVTNTCQPQCRLAVLNLYQNRLGRALLRTDLSCVNGRNELQLCHLSPLQSPMHCTLAKLVCEADLQCNAKWDIFVAECESEASQSRCSSRCMDHLSSTLDTPHGSAFYNCTCSNRNDQLCDNLKDVILKSCMATSMATSTNILGNNEEIQSTSTITPSTSRKINSANIDRCQQLSLLFAIISLINVIYG